MAISFISCASSELKARLKSGEIEIAPISDIARTSYLKGCTENTKLHFELCVKKSKEHAKEIKEILMQ